MEDAKNYAKIEPNSVTDYWAARWAVSEASANQLKKALAVYSLQEEKNQHA